MRLQYLRSLPATWRAHGLSFSQLVESDADVRFAFRAAPLRLDVPTREHRDRDARPGDWLLRLAPDQRLRATGGRLITVDVAPDVDERELVRWVIGATTTAILYQRRLVPLHASAVVIDGSLVAFLAPSNVGKSSLAAACVAEGAVAFADDTLAVHRGDGVVPASPPGWTQLRVPAATWTSLDPTAFRVLREESDGTRIVHSAPPVADDALPLAALFLLQIGDRLEVERLTPFDLLTRLRGLLSRPSLSRPLGVETGVFSSLGQIAAQVPAWRIMRPAGEASLPAVSAIVRRSLHMHAHDAPTPGLQ
ncbi:MAG: hypothetical protein ABI910_11760 [Gemmatimonadota bacterium]